MPDMAVIGILALLFFGPDQLPKVAKRFGHVMRDVQNTSAAFIREMERAADDEGPPGRHEAAATEPPVAEEPHRHDATDAEELHGHDAAPAAPRSDVQA